MEQELEIKSSIEMNIKKEGFVRVLRGYNEPFGDRIPCFLMETLYNKNTYQSFMLCTEDFNKNLYIRLYVRHTLIIIIILYLEKLLIEIRI